MKSIRWKIACALWLIIFFLLGIGTIHYQDTDPLLSLLCGLGALVEGALGLFLLGITSGYPYGK